MIGGVIALLWFSSGRTEEGVGHVWASNHNLIWTTTCKICQWICSLSRNGRQEGEPEAQNW